MLNLIIFKYTMYMLKRHKVKMISSEGVMPITEESLYIFGQNKRKFSTFKLFFPSIYFV